MKKILTLSLLIFASSFAYAQDANADLNIRFNQTEQRYEVYSKPSTSKAFNLGPAQISLVLPAALSDSPISVVSVNGGTWVDNTQVIAPSVTSNFDYHGFGTGGDPQNQLVWVAGQELLMFHFTVQGGCVSGLRVFENGVDPNSLDAGMQGADFGNSFAGEDVLIDHYNSVYDNTGTSCDVPCEVNAPSLSIN